VGKDIDVDEHGRLSNLTLRYKLMYMNIVLIAV